MAFYDLNMNSKRVTNAQDPSSAQDVATKNYVDTYFMRQVKVERFTASGTFTPPAGTTYAVAHLKGGGGSVSYQGSPAVNGGDSSVAFPAPVGTITALGGQAQTNLGNYQGSGSNHVPGVANSGQGAKTFAFLNTNTQNFYSAAEDGAEIVAGSAVVAGTPYAVVVGIGGTAVGSISGGSGYVWIEYY